MPLYERRKGGRAIERVRTVARSFEDTRLGLLAGAREEKKSADGWHVVDETRPAAPAPTDEKPKGTTGG